jgi:hypothetical protein
MTTTSEGKPSLRVIEGAGICRWSSDRLPTHGEFILPPVELPWKEIFSTWLGMTSRQSNTGFYLAAPMDGKKTAARLQRLTAAIRVR